MQDEKEIKEEEIAETLPASEEGLDQQEPIHEDSQENIVDEPIDSTPPEKMFTQDEVNELIGKTRNEARQRANSAYYERYGVENDDELNDLVGRGQSYKVLEDKYNNTVGELERIKTDYALLKSGIVPNRYDDVKFILKGKGLEINEDTINQELATHPEWKAMNVSQPEPTPEPVVTQPQAQPVPSQGFGDEDDYGVDTNVFTEEMGEEIANTPKAPKRAPLSNVVKKLGNTIPETEESDDEEARVLKMFNV